MKRTIWAAVILFLAVLTIAMAIQLRTESAPILVTSLPFTSTPESSLLPTPTSTPRSHSLDLPGCVLWYELGNHFVGDEVCVVGYIKVMVRPDPGSEVVRIYLKPELSRGDRRRIGAPKDFYLFDAFFSDTDLRMDECVTASGILSVNHEGELFMRLDDNLQKCP